MYSDSVPEESDDEARPPELYELLKERFDKLISKSDPMYVLLSLPLSLALNTTIGARDGRLLSNEFMQLPSKKQWPFYYVEIKNPKCFDDIDVCIVLALTVPHCLKDDSGT